MNVFRRKTPGLADDDTVTLLLPFEDGPRTYAQPLAHLGGNRHLALSRNLRVRKRHNALYITTVMDGAKGWRFASRLRRSKSDL